MILEFKDWTISPPAGPLGYQLDNDTRKLTLQGDLPPGWTWDVLVEVGDNSDIWLLTPTEEGASITLTDENLSIRGAYYLQVRGTRGSQVKHCNVVTAYVLRTLAGAADWPTLPTEFAQVEQNIKELNAHPPIPGENGYWLLWDLAEAAYRESQLPVPVGPAGPANTLTIGTVETLPADQPATASITGESPAQKLNLGIPQGKQGATGNPGAPGKDGQTPTIAVGTVTTLDPGQDATAEITGETPNLTLNLGIPEGQPGKDGVQLNDSAINTTEAWSSKKIVDTLCPSFSVSGNPVTCNPVEDYPLGAVVTLEPKQAGSGDPSPENVRPISGWDEVTVNVRGKNLVDFTKAEARNSSETVEILKDGVKWSGTYYFLIPVSGLPRGATIVASYTSDMAGTWRVQYSDKSYSGTSGVLKGTPITLDSAKEIEHIVIYKSNTGTFESDMVFTDIQVEFGSTPTPYEPYQGDTYDIALLETVYGGTVDCVTGKGKKTWETILIDEDFIANNIFSEYGSDQGKPGFSIVLALNGTYNRTNGFCSHAEVALNSNPTPDAKSFIWLGVNNNFIYWLDAFAAFGVSSLNDAKNALIAQATAGTPVTIAYQLATPEPFDVTPHPIPALPGVNTLYTDGDSLEVSGRRDLLSTLEDLQHTLTAVTNIISEGGLT